MADVKWIKIYIDCFKNGKLKYIEGLPRGDTILKIWFKLLCLAGESNSDGCLMITENIPYTEKTLFEAVTNARLDETAEFFCHVTVTLLSLNMIEKIGDRIYIRNWLEYQNGDKLADIREKNRLRQQKCRESKEMSQKKRDKPVTEGVTKSVTKSVTKALPSYSPSISNSYSNKEELLELQGNTNLIKDCLELYKKYAPKLFVKEEGLNLFNGFGKGVSAVATAIEDNPPLTEKEYIALLERAEKSEYIQSMERPSLEYLIKKKGEILNGERDKLFGKKGTDKPKDSVMDILGDLHNEYSKRS
ncbi:MAG: hypothetical protein EOM59_11720 [Clostridia bacterium]|nr:hypothetical protein [Clostridia bacterium]